MLLSALLHSAIMLSVVEPCGILENPTQRTTDSLSRTRDREIEHTLVIEKTRVRETAS
jgi:hypothetical protein